MALAQLFWPKLSQIPYIIAVEDVGWSQARRESVRRTAGFCVQLAVLNIGLNILITVGYRLYYVFAGLLVAYAQHFIADIYLRLRDMGDADRLENRPWFKLPSS